MKDEDCSVEITVTFGPGTLGDPKHWNDWSGIGTLSEVPPTTTTTLGYSGTAANPTYYDWTGKNFPKRGTPNGDLTWSVEDFVFGVDSCDQTDLLEIKYWRKVWNQGGGPNSPISFTANGSTYDRVKLNAVCTGCSSGICPF